MSRDTFWTNHVASFDAEVEQYELWTICIHFQYYSHAVTLHRETTADWESVPLFALTHTHTHTYCAHPLIISAP